MRLGDLILWLKAQNRRAIVQDGFGSPHSYRGSYDCVAFTPKGSTTFGEMLYYAQCANGQVFEGYKGGEFLMGEDTECYIADYGDIGEPITSTHLKYWALVAEEVGRK